MESISCNMNRMPELQGPIPVTAESHPFCSMLYSRTRTDPAAYGYAEEEFFLSGTAAVYGADKNDFPAITKSGLPYKTRLLVRRPLDMTKFSGRVYVDILNATQGYDIEDLWHRNARWCMKNGHGYAGISSKPVCAMSLKLYDYERYQSLNWSNGEEAPRPAVLRYASIPGTEEGLFWDMLGQLASLLRRENNCFKSAAEFVYLCGQSQSGAYLNTFIHYFDPWLKDTQGKKLFDGFFNIAGAQLRRKICQDAVPEPLRFYAEPIRPASVPFISLSAEGDVALFKKHFQADILTIKIPNENTDANKRRHYDIAGIPHTNTACPLLPSDEELAKMGRVQNSFPETNRNDFPAEYYITGLLEKLHLWASRGTAPEIVPAFEEHNGDIARDEHGNARGGLRSPFLDIPAASYLGSNPCDPEGISGTITFFPKEKFAALYGGAESYIERFAAYTRKQQEAGWISAEDAEAMTGWAKQAAQQIMAKISP